MSAIIARDIPGAASSPTTAEERITCPPIGAFSTAFSATTPATEPMGCGFSAPEVSAEPRSCLPSTSSLATMSPSLTRHSSSFPDDLGAHRDHVRGHPRVVC